MQSVCDNIKIRSIVGNNLFGRGFIHLLAIQNVIELLTAFQMELVLTFV